MAFATLEAVSTTFSAPSTEHTITLPAGITADDRLVMFLGIRRQGAALTSGLSGWSTIAVSSAGGQVQLRCLSKNAAGTEGTSTTATWGATCQICAAVYRFSGGSTGTNPSASTAVVSPTNPSGAGNSPDPPSVTASWGGDDNTWLAATAYRLTGSVNGIPASYSSFVQVESNLGSTAVGLAVARRELNSASEDPSSFTVAGNSTVRWQTITAVIRPETAAAGGPGPAGSRLNFTGYGR